MNEENMQILTNTINLVNTAVDRMVEVNRRWFQLVLVSILSSTILLGVVCLYAITQMYK